MQTLMDSRPVSASLRTGSRPSTTQEKTEFLELLNALGVRRIRRSEKGWQSVQCFRLHAHAHGDRKPSLSVILDTCGFHCHGCGIRGGLVALRQHAGTGAPRGQIAPAVFPLARLGSLDAHPLSLVPVEEVEELRRKTKRHKRDGRLNDHLRLLLAIIAERMIEEGHTRNVRFTATDARLGGLRVETWSDLLPLLHNFGIDVSVGECGKKVHLGKVEAVKATLVSLAPIRNTPVATSGAGSAVTTSTPSASSTGEYSDFDSPGHRVTIQAAQATQRPSHKVKPDCATVKFPVNLKARPTAALMVGVLANLHREIAASGGARTVSETTTIGHLRTLFGSRTWRAVHSLESLGMVKVARSGRSHGVITLTDEGRRVWERDVERGIDALCGQVTKQLTDWLKKQDEARRRYRARTQSAVVDFVTGEVITRNAGAWEGLPERGRSICVG